LSQTDTAAVKVLSILIASLFGLAAPAHAQEPPPERTSSVVVYGDDPCPKASEEEIVVCARRPESDRYRIPKDLRNAGDPPSEVAWGARTELLEDAARTNLPGSCSVVGSNGQTGCQRQLVDQWYKDRRGRRSR
jgi:hypothetical protein